MIDEYKNDIEQFKELAANLPVNNIANRRKKKEIIKKEDERINEIMQDVRIEIDRRLTKLNSFKEPDLSSTEKKLSACRIVHELNDYNTPFEKMHLDYYLYQLHRYYKEDLDSVNTCLMKIIESFNKVGIWLVEDDFDLSKYAKEYLGAILNKRSDETISEIFDKIYWQCPEIITSIETNIDRIYLKNVKNIEKYYEERRNEFLANHNKDELKTKYIDLTKEYQYLGLSSEYNIINRFKNKEWLVADLDTANIQKRISSIFGDSELDMTLLMQLEESLYEYKVYLKYEYLLKNMKTKLNEKDSYKGKRSAVLKEITKLESKLLDLNKKQDKKPLFGMINKKKKENMVFEINNSLKALQDKYNELEISNFNDIIYNKLSKDSTIYEVLECISANYLYFVNETKKKEEELTLKELSNLFEELKNDLYQHNYNILSNVILLEDRDIKMILTDKYKLKKIILPEELDIEKTESILNDIFYIKVSEMIKNSDVTLSEMTFILDSIKRGLTI